MTRFCFNITRWTITRLRSYEPSLDVIVFKFVILLLGYRKNTEIRQYKYLDFSVEPKVKDCKDGEGYEGHPEEVCNQDVVPRVRDRHLKIIISDHTKMMIMIFKISLRMTAIYV